MSARQFPVIRHRSARTHALSTHNVLMPEITWEPDILGPGFESTVLTLPHDAKATLVRLVDEETNHPHRGDAPAAEAPRTTALPAAGSVVLHLHGWSDYFYHAHVARFWAERGAHFFAIDLRDYGRNLRPNDPDQRPGYIDDLESYFEEIDAAREIIESLHPGRKLILSGHSTGGLTASLWAHQHPGVAAALTLNAPWLEFQYSRAARKVLQPLVTRAASASGSLLGHRTQGPLPLRFPNYYAIAASQNHGAPPYDLTYKPPNSFRVYAAWLSAVFRGHQQVEAGLDITCPVLVQASTRTLRKLSYDPQMGSTDIVLDVNAIAKRALDLGPLVVVQRIEGAVHDVFLSSQTVVSTAFDGLEKFVQGYVADPQHAE